MDERALRAECLDLLHRMEAVTRSNEERLRADDTADLDLGSLTFDSLTLLDFCIRLEERIGAEVEPGDVLAVSSLNALVSSLAARAAR